jgi:tetratricopeptide (TPR) repeat protein
MIGRAAGGNLLSSEAIEQIAAKTDGVPLFIEELTKMVLESSMLFEGVDSGAPPESLPTLAIPTTLHDSLMARLDRLGPVKEVAQLGATIGRAFAHDVLQAVADINEVTLQHGLRQLVEAELLYQQGVPPQATYTFKHALIQDVAAQSLLRSTRQQYHRRIAQVIETQFADVAETHPELLAHHYAAARLPAQALPYYRRAGENAVARSAYREAVTLFERALETTQHLPDCRDSTVQAIDLRLALRLALRPLGEFERILAYLREAEVEAEAINDANRLAQITGFLAIHFRLAGAYDQGIAAGRRSLAYAQVSGNMGLYALANQHLGNVYEGKSDYRRAIEFFGNTVASLPEAKQYERYGQIFLPAVQSRAWLSTCHAELGMFAKGAHFGAEGLKIAEEFNHPASLMIALFGMGQLSLRQGDLSQALPLLERSMNVCRDADLSSYFSLMATGLGGAWTLVGRAADAVSLLKQAQEPDMPGSHLRCLIALSEAYLAAGQRTEAYASAKQALTFAQTSKSRGLQAYARRLLGDIAMHTDSPNFKQAATHYQQALALAEALGMRPLQAHCHRALGDLRRQGDQPEQAYAELTTAIDMYRDMEMTFWLPETEVALAAVEGKA